jgi:branched-chain amino acid transport system ATP-binding protein
VRSESPHRRSDRGLCLIPEGRGVFKSLSVRENLRLQIPRGEADPKDAIERALAVFPVLGSRMKLAAGHLSGGQQQMLSLARAYVTRPKVILLDEVSLGLAPLVVDEVFEALRILAKTGVAMLMVEQYITRAMEMADVVVLLNKGAVSYDGPPSGLDEQAVLLGYLGVKNGLTDE